MYEKTKRGNQKQQKKESPNKKDAKAIILNWNIRLGECELQTYTLDGKRRGYIIQANCM